MPSKYEIAAEETVPAARSMIAKALVGKYKMKETEVAGHLGVAQAAVSNYVRGKRSISLKKKAKHIELMVKGDSELIDGYIRKISEGKREYVNICICRICSVANDFSCGFSHAGPESAADSKKK
jgi:predicted transcriptional regulator